MNCLKKLISLIMVILMLLSVSLVQAFAFSDDYVGLHGERNEFDFSELNLVSGMSKDAPNGLSWLDMDSGGNATEATAYLARWDGPVDEFCDPYDEYTEEHVYKKYDQVARVGNVLKFATDVDSIKSAVKKYGALYASFPVDWSAFNDDYSTYNVGNDVVAGHAITIVGWDDSFSKNRFVNVPEADGAFICKNSWGTNNREDGYFYMSYESHIDDAYAFEVLPSDTDYNKIYQYDELGATSYIGYLYDDIDYVANVFPEAGKSLTSNETLKAVSFYTMDTDEKYTVYIITDFKNKNDIPNKIKNGTAVVAASGTLENSGYHVIDLTKEVKLSAGTRFAVAIKLNDRGYNSAMYACEAANDYGAEKARANKGESYYVVSDLTLDLCDEAENSNWCIKAFTDYTPQETAQQNQPVYYKAISNNTRRYESSKVNSVSALMKKGFKFNPDYIKYINGEINCGEIVPSAVEFKTEKSVATEALPKKYDLRDYGLVSTVKDQNPYGTCWAHASLASLESSALEEYSKGNDINNAIKLEENKSGTYTINSAGDKKYFKFAAPMPGTYEFNFTGNNLKIDKVSKLGLVLKSYTSNNISVELKYGETILFCVGFKSGITGSFTAKVNPDYIYDESRMIELEYDGSGPLKINNSMDGDYYDIIKITNKCNCELLSFEIAADSEIELFIDYGSKPYFEGSFCNTIFETYLMINESVTFIIKPISGKVNYETTFKMEMIGEEVLLDIDKAIPLTLNEGIFSESEDLLYSFTPSFSGYYSNTVLSSFMNSDLEYLESDEYYCTYLNKGETYYFICYSEDYFVNVVEKDSSKRPPINMELDKNYIYNQTEDGDTARFSFVAPESGKYVFTIKYGTDVELKDCNGNIIGNRFIIDDATEYIYCELNKGEKYILNNNIDYYVCVEVNKTDKTNFFDNAKEISVDKEYTCDTEKEYDIYFFTVPQDGYYSINSDAYFSIYNAEGNNIQSYDDGYIYRFEKGEKIYMIMYSYYFEDQFKVSTIKENYILTEDNEGVAVIGENDEYVEFKIDMTNILKEYDGCSINIKFNDIENIESVRFYESDTNWHCDVYHITEDGVNYNTNKSLVVRVYIKSPGIIIANLEYDGYYAFYVPIENDSDFWGYNWQVGVGCSFKIETKNTDKFTFSSSNTDIATVDENGTVKGISPGVATIIIKSNDEKEVYKYKVYVFKTYMVSFYGGKKGDTLIKNVLVSDKGRIITPTKKEINVAKKPFFKCFTGNWLDENGNVVDLESIIVQKDMILHAEYVNFFVYLFRLIFG